MPSGCLRRNSPAPGLSRADEKLPRRPGRRYNRGMRGIFNIIIGIVFIIGGLSGHLVLIGTGSGLALAVLGAFLLGLGIFRMLRTQ